MEMQVRENASPIIDFVEQVFVEQFEESFHINEYGEVQPYEEDSGEGFLEELFDELSYLVQKLGPEQLAALTPAIITLVDAVKYTYDNVED